MAYEILQSSAQSVLLFYMTDSVDHLSAKTGLTCTVTISKNGGAFATPSGAVSEVGNGWYKVAGNGSDTNTLGPIALRATAAGADNCDIIVVNVVGYDPQATLSQSNVTQIAGVSASATNLSRTTQAITICTVGTGSSTTSIITSSMDPVASVVDQFKGRIVTFDRSTTTPGLRGQATDITGSTATGVLTVSTLTTAPVSGDTFTIT
jgi:hypothetical protein